MGRLDSKLLEILVCPVCKGSLKWCRDEALLVCLVDHLSYPVRDGVPVLIESEASSFDDVPSC